jgi:serine-type D-Ala-D-Ala carboxypeptidase (penicillin-binding protein 5/6)
MEGNQQDQGMPPSTGAATPSFSLPPVELAPEPQTSTADGDPPIAVSTAAAPGPVLPPPPTVSPPTVPPLAPDLPAAPIPPLTPEATSPDPLPGRGVGRRQRRRRRRRRVWIAIAVVVVVIAALVVVQLRRALPQATVHTTAARTSTVPGQAPALAWPATGYGAVAIPSLGYTAQSGPEVPVPVASLTKMMVAVVILQDHPLAAGADGPSVTITAQDVAEDSADVSTDQSTVPVQVGEVLTERQLLEGLLVRSANNMAFTLARWDAGSLPAFIAKMNTGATQLGMTQTHYVDVSGYNPGSVSTPADSLKVAARGLADPTFAAIVAMPSVTLPVAGLVPNIVTQIGSNGIIGVKSGFTSAAGPCLVLATNRTVGGKTVQAIAAVTNQPPSGTDPFHNAAMTDEALLQASLATVFDAPVATSGHAVATVGASWGGVRHDVPVATAQGASVLAVPGQSVTATVVTGSVASGAAPGSSVGHVVYTLGPQRQVVPLQATEQVPTPSLVWRLTHT